MSISHTIQYLALRAFAAAICILPLNTALAVGRSMGTFGWALRLRRPLVLRNIAIAKPQANPTERYNIGKQAAQNFGVTIAEFIRYGIKDRDALHQRIAFEGIDKLRHGLAEGKGALVLTGHLGAWAIYFGALALKDIPIALLVGKQHNEKVDRFIHRIPGDRVEMISKGRSAVKRIKAKLEEGCAVVMVADQHAGASGVMVPFLGRPSPTLSLPGAFAVKHQCPVFMMVGHRNYDGSHHVVIEKLDLPDDGPPEERKVEILRRYNRAIGEAILKWPEQYFWYHRRWRPSDQDRMSTKPSNDPLP